MTDPSTGNRITPSFTVPEARALHALLAEHLPQASNGGTTTTDLHTAYDRLTAHLYLFENAIKDPVVDDELWKINTPTGGVPNSVDDLAARARGLPDDLASRSKQD